MSAALQAIAADCVFDGDRLHGGAAAVVAGDMIVAVVSDGEIPAGAAIERLPAGAWLAPGFIDVQVNGGGDVLFNDALDVDGIATIAAAHRRFGTTSLLPTLITDRPDKLKAGIEAVREALRSNPSVLGIHLEGPFIAPQRPGVHDPAAIRRPEAADLELLARLKGGVTLVTLAPEEVPPGFIASLAPAGVRVSLGHSMATYDQTRAAIAEGLTGFTHLFNAMRPLGSRDPGPIAAAHETPGCSYGLIVDGEHVHPAMLRLALRGAGRPMLVTDAMPPVGGKRKSFSLYGEEIAVRDRRCVRSDGTLAGAALDMASAVRNAVRLLGIDLSRALQMASTAPADFLGVGQRLGRIKPGARADLVALDPEEVRVLRTWVAGAASPSAPPTSRSAASR
jgi:N-acetylglucosamine-6-phosphate deacetylase